MITWTARRKQPHHLVDLCEVYILLFVRMFADPFSVSKARVVGSMICELLPCKRDRSRDRDEVASVLHVPCAKWSGCRVVLATEIG